MKPRTFRAKIEPVGPGASWFRLHLPFDVEKAFGSRGRVSVKGTIGGFPFESSIFPNGDGTHHLMVNKAMREGADAEAGDTVAVKLEPDTAPRVVAAPPDLERALKAAPKAKAFFEALAPAYKKRWVSLLDEAKKPETRAKRVEKIVAMLAAGKKAPS